MARTVPLSVLEPLSITCGKCGSENATLYATARGGSVVCPTCTPAWLADAVKSASELFVKHIKEGGKSGGR